MADDNVIKNQGSKVLAALDKITKEYRNIVNDTDGVLFVKILPISVTAGTLTTVEVDTTSTVVIPANSDRKWFYVVNNGNKDAWMSFGGTAVEDVGIVLKKKGTSLIFDSTKPITDAVSFVVGGGSTDIDYQEFT